MSLPQHLADLLPAGSVIEHIAFVAKGPQNSSVQVEFPAAIHRQAVLVDANDKPDGPEGLTLLVVPTTTLLDDGALTALRTWCNEEQSTEAMVMSLQHVQVIWNAGRIAIVAGEDRLATVKKSIIEATYYINQLDSIEQELGALWPKLEADLPFAFDQKLDASSHKERLAEAFQHVYLLRMRLSRITPFLLLPHTYPPTLASQIGERLRERARVEDREEFLSDQLETFEEVYEMCGQRVSDHQHAKTGHTLEVIIIIILAAEILLTIFDFVTSAGA